MKKPVVRNLLLENHKEYIYEYDTIDEALEHVELFERYRRAFLKKRPNAKFKIVADFTTDKKLVTVETWIFPRSLQN